MIYKGFNEHHWDAFRLVFFILILATIFSIFFACSSSVSVDNSTVKTIDLNQYQGKWYEVARMDHWFERDMQYCTAFYSQKEDGTIAVTNRGLKNGKWKTSIGKAKVTNQQGVLRVSFFGPFYSDYRVLMLASDYSYALVGGNGDDYLWILSRTPNLPSNVRDQLINEARKRGYQTKNLIWVKHALGTGP